MCRLLNASISFEGLGLAVFCIMTWEEKKFDVCVGLYTYCTNECVPTYICRRFGSQWLIWKQWPESSDHHFNNRLFSVHKGVIVTKMKYVESPWKIMSLWSAANCFLIYNSGPQYVFGVKGRTRSIRDRKVCTEFLLKNKRPTWCHLLFYFTSYVLSIFRTLIYPSSGACDCVVELPHRSFCSQFVLCWRFGAVGFE